MHDELPEVLGSLPRPPAPAHLRTRVLAAVDAELARRRKPRWELLLERSVAAAFLFGVGLNAWHFLPAWQVSPARQPAQHATPRTSFEDAPARSKQALAEQRLRQFGPLDKEYSQLLIELLERSAG